MIILYILAGIGSMVVIWCILTVLLANDDYKTKLDEHFKNLKNE